VVESLFKDVRRPSWAHLAEKKADVPTFRICCPPLQHKRSRRYSERRVGLVPSRFQGSDRIRRS